MRKYKILKFLVIILFFIVSDLHAYQTSIIGETNKFKATISKIIHLKENIEPLSEVNSIALNADGSFYITSKSIAQLLNYDSKGTQIKKIGRWGRGPFEYQRPTILEIYKKHLYLWDQISYKLIIYNKNNGKPIDEMLLFASNVTDFDICENKVFFYSQSGTEQYISGYNLKNNKLLFKTGWKIEKKMEHLLLMMFAGSGQLTCFTNNVYYSLPSKSGVVKYDIENNEDIFQPIKDEKFKIGDSGYENLKELNRNIKEAIKYPFFNSRNLGVFKLSNFILTINENGLYNPNVIGGTWDFDYEFNESKRRRHTLFILDYNLSLIDTINIPPEIQEKIGLKVLGVYNNTIIYLKRTYDDNTKNVDWKLTFLKIEKV